jgi:hypothetical protein
MLLAAMTACADDDGKDPGASGSPTPSSSPTTASPAPTAPSESEVASEAASAVVRRFFATVDAVRQDSSRPSTDLAAVAASIELAAQKKLLSSQREKGLRQVGNTTVVTLEVQSISLDNSDPATGHVPTAVVDVCWDVSQVDVLDRAGQSVVSPDRPSVGRTRLTVANFAYATDPAGGWRVSGGKDLKKASCAAS